MYCTILSNLNDRLFDAKIFLYMENERSTSADVKGANLKYTISLLVNYFGISKFSSSPLNIFEILQSISNPLFFLSTVCNFWSIAVPL